MFKKTKSIEEEYVRICPRCMSTNISREKNNLVGIAYAFPAKYRCKKCGFLSNIFPEIRIKDIRRQKSKTRKSQKLSP